MRVGICIYCIAKKEKCNISVDVDYLAWQSQMIQHLQAQCSLWTVIKCLLPGSLVPRERSA